MRAEPPLGLRSGWSLHAETAFPFGALNPNYDPGPAATLDYVYAFSRQVGVDGRLGYTLFSGSSSTSSLDVWNFSANLKCIIRNG
ncbi:MAG: hypothetical protein MJB57_01000 [Gemmatimonadetes bacterium]|nr:hypothetical protein [Gemmatimonadota bacterium]